MLTNQLDDIRDKLIDRKNKLVNLSQKFISVTDILALIDEIGDALERISDGTYGICEVCGGEIEVSRLAVDPLIRVCLDDMNAEQQKTLESDLELAMKIQRNLLPPKGISLPGWDIAYHYEPASLVSGDYCDVIRPEETCDHHYIIVGDVTGKGVAASMLMTHLHAMFHTLVPLKLKLNELMERTNRQLCESTDSNLFATLLLARAFKDGTVEISNAGHCLPLLISENGTKELDSTGIPLGVMCAAIYESSQIKMQSGDVLFIYTDGLSEAMKKEELFEISRIIRHEKDFCEMSAQRIIEVALDELNTFLDGSAKADDLTMMVLKKI